MRLHTIHLKYQPAGICLIASFAFIICLTSRVCAETEVTVDDLYGLLGTDSRVEADPNAAIPAAPEAVVPAAAVVPDETTVPAEASPVAVAPAAAAAVPPSEMPAAAVPTAPAVSIPAEVVPPAAVSSEAVAAKEVIVIESAKPVNTSAEENDLILTGNPTTSIQKEVWKARISASDETAENQSRNELEQLIAQLNAIEIKIPAAKAEPVVAVVEPVTETEPNTVVADPEPVQEEAAEKTEKKAANGSVSEETLQEFKALAKNPDQLRNPLELAEILFNSGCLEDAAACYQVALNRLKGEDADPLENKAWIYLQLGNCFKNSDPKTALENYQTVVDEFPYSPWAQLAKTKSELIIWYLKDQPEVLIDASKTQISE